MSRIIRSARVATVSAFALLALGSGLAAAQDQATATTVSQANETKAEVATNLFAEGDPNLYAVDEITVTARKREESLQEVPISITAFSANQLQSMGLNNNDQVANMTVNFNTMAQLGRRLDRPVIRGMAAPETFGEPNASYFIDGAYLSGSISAYTLGPIERVEILRGPQSAQFGRATFSGAVNYVTRKPTNDMAGDATVKVGQDNTRLYSAWASGPIVEDNLLFFASGSYDQYGGQWNNDLQDGQAGNANSFIDPPQWGDNSDLGGTQTKQAEGKLLWLITEDAELMFKAGLVRTDDDHYPQLIVETDELNCFVPGQDLTPADPNYYTSPGAYCGTIDPDNRQNRLNIPDFRQGMVSVISPDVPNAFLPNKTPEDYISPPREPGAKRDQYNYLLVYEQDFSDWISTSRVAYNKSELITAYDLDGYQTRALSGQFGFYEDFVRNDASFESRLDSPGDKPVRGSIGVYYFYLKEDSANASSPGITGLGQVTAPVTSRTDNYALFGAIDWDITDQWSLTAEARWARDVKTIDSPNSCDDPDSPYYDPDNTLSQEVGQNSLTPRFTVRYQLTEEAMVYAQAANGNKPGAFNIGFYRQGRDACFAEAEFAAGDDGPYVEEEKQWTYELGTKTTWLQNRLTANLAVFYIDWENQTFFETTAIPGEVTEIPTAIGFNAGKSRIYGLELETSWAITDKLLGTFAYGFTDGEYREGFSENFADVTGDRGDENGNLRGNTIPNSPRHNFVTSLAYTDAITSELNWFARTDYSYESGRYSAANNFAEIGKRQLWNARGGLETDRWTATLFVNNLLDKITPSAIIGFPRFGETTVAGDIPLQGYALSPIPGRIFGAEFIMRFGAY